MQPDSGWQGGIIGALTGYFSVLPVQLGHNQKIPRLLLGHSHPSLVFFSPCGCLIGMLPLVLRVSRVVCFLGWNTKRRHPPHFSSASSRGLFESMNGFPFSFGTIFQGAVRVEP